MNKDRYNALPPDIKKIFDEVSAEWTDVHGKIWDTIDEDGFKYAKELGLQIITLSEAESARWVEAVKSIIDNYAAEIPDGEKYINKLRALIKKHSK